MVFKMAYTGRPLPDEFWPKTARLKGERKTLPSRLHFCDLPGVSEEWVEEIEALEPGIHEFREVEVFAKDGRRRTERFFALNVLQILDQIVDFDLTSAPVSMVGSRRVTSPQEGHQRGVVFKRAVIEGHHLWYSPEVTFYAMTISDQLYERLASRKLLKSSMMIEALQA